MFQSTSINVQSDFEQSGFEQSDTKSQVFASFLQQMKGEEKDYFYQVTAQSPTIAYDHYSKMLTTKNICCEPMKNLLVQMQFLTQYAKDGDTVMYAASFHINNERHLSKLICMFQHLNLRWHIYGIQQQHMQTLRTSLPDSNVTMYDHKLNADTVDTWRKAMQKKMANTQLLFINNSKKDCKLDEQMLWVQALCPRASCLKLQAVYDNLGTPLESFEYLDGKAYMQPFASANCAEMALFCSREDIMKRKTYSHRHLEEAAAFFNRIVRTKDNSDMNSLQCVADAYAIRFKVPLQKENLQEFLVECLRLNRQHFSK